MNALRTLFRALLLLIVIAAFVIDAAQAAQPAPAFRFDCNRRHVSQADVARLFDAQNVSQTCVGCQTPYLNLAGHCAGGRGPALAANAAECNSATLVHGY